MTDAHELEPRPNEYATPPVDTGAIHTPDIPEQNAGHTWQLDMEDVAAIYSASRHTFVAIASRGSSSGAAGIHAPEDIVQDVIEKTLRRAHAGTFYSSSPHHAAGYVAKTVLTTTTDKFRSERLAVRNISLSAQDPGDKPIDIADTAQDIDTLTVSNAYFARVMSVAKYILDPKHYEVLCMMASDPYLTGEQIANRLDIPLGTAKGRISSMRKAMMPILEDPLAAQASWLEQK
jgi:DNA-directed RNA polymerase specialized sigma24 family protein